MVGLSYLTKGTILPSLILFATLYGAKLVIFTAREIKRRDSTHLREATKQLGYLIILLAVFTITISPYIREMKRRFGQYFYNVNTTFYIWFDSYDQAMAEEEKHHFTEQWPIYENEDQIPSMRKYLSEHTPQQIIERFRIGAVMQLKNIYIQYSVANYPLSYLLIFLGAILINVKNSIRTARDYPYLVLFTVLYFLGYLVAFSWYAPIAGGRRFIFGLYIPFLMGIFISINELSRKQSITYGNRGNQVNLERFFTTANIFIALTLIYNIWLVLTELMFYSRFGS
jgi:hypothetical protein